MTKYETFLNCLLNMVKQHKPEHQHNILNATLTNFYAVGNKAFSNGADIKLHNVLDYIMLGWGEILEASKIGLFYPENWNEIANKLGVNKNIVETQNDN